MSDRLPQRDIVSLISPERIAADLWKLVCVPSPTRRERVAAAVFAQLLDDCGAGVQVDQTIPESPSVIGLLGGGTPGPTIQLAGHIDHIDVPHEKPSRSGDVISGRGAPDMKAGLACILEIVRLLAAEGSTFPGQVLVTVYGLHEAPLGGSEALRGLIERKVTGDAALVMEGPPGAAIICGKGQSIWTLTLERAGSASHELRRPPGADGLIEAAAAVVQAFRAEDQRLSAVSHELLGAESIFIGQLHHGDFYNRSPRSCTMQGTRRWLPGTTFAEVRAHMDRLLASVALPTGIKAGVEWTFVGESFSIDPNERIVRSLREASRMADGVELPLGGVSSLLDTSRLVPYGGVPTVPIDCDGATAHADEEYVKMPTVAAGCALALRTVVNYLYGPQENQA